MKTSLINPLSKRHRGILMLMLLLLFCILLTASGSGAYWIPPWKIPKLLWTHGEGFLVLWTIRFPRVILGGLVGMCLAVSGASLQGLFRNPLADPGLLGVNAGAGLGAALWIVLIDSGSLGIWGVPMAAFVGAWLVLWGAWQLAKSGGPFTVMILLLAGIAMNSFSGSGIGLMTFMADDQKLRSLTFWMLGGLGGATWPLVFTVFT
ncbi:MAG: iron ABC transporter permease, partial [Myxococcota bacterium]